MLHLGLLIALGPARAQPTVTVPGEAASLSEALELVDAGGTITVAENLDLSLELCVEIHKAVSVIGQGTRPEIPGLFSDHVELTLDNLTLVGGCEGPRSTYTSADDIYAHMIVHDGEVFGTNLSLPRHDGVGIVISDAEVELIGVEANGNQSFVFYLESAMEETLLSVRESTFDANLRSVFYALGDFLQDPPIRVSLQDSVVTRAWDPTAGLAVLTYADMDIIGTTVSGLGSDGGGDPIPESGLILSYGGSLNIADSSFSDCRGLRSGAIYAEGQNEYWQTVVDIRDTSFERCGADPLEGVGGVMHVLASDLVLDGVTARDVFAQSGAFLYFSDGDAVTMRDVAVLGYETSANGAIFVRRTLNFFLTRARICGGVADAGAVAGLETFAARDARLHNLVVQGVESSGGSAALFSEGAVELRNSTLAGNAVQDLVIADVVNLHLYNNIFSGSPDAVGVRVVQPPAQWVGGYNLWYELNANTDGFSDLEDPATDLSLDPLFIASWQADNCASLPRPDLGSPVIDAGNPDPTLNDPDGSRSDIGAFGGPDGAWAETDTGADDSGTDDSGTDDSGTDDSPTVDSNADDSASDPAGDSADDPSDDKAPGCGGCASRPGATEPGEPGGLWALLALTALGRRLSLRPAPKLSR